MKVLFIAIGIIIAAALLAALRVFFGLGHPGNAAPYALRRQPRRENSPLRGKTILCLGSSISSGFSSGGVSFLDYLGRIDGCRILSLPSELDFIILYFRPAKGYRFVRIRYISANFSKPTKEIRRRSRCFSGIHGVSF